MAKDKEKSINPAQAARKAEKAKALKKGKAAIAQQRNDRLAKQNPHRIQSQIDDLKALEANHSINPREKKHLDELERELARVIKAKEAAGEKYVPRTQEQQRARHNVLGKRTRGSEDGLNGRQTKRPWSPESSETDEDVRNIPMPRDTPPPIPRRRREDGEQKVDHEERQVHALPEKAESVPSQAVYESKPVLRDLRKEAAAFVPAAVRKRQAEGGASAPVPVPVKSEEVKEESVAQRTNGLGASSDKNLQMMDMEFENDLKQLEQADVRWRQEAKQATVEEVVDEDS